MEEKKDLETPIQNSETTATPPLGSPEPMAEAATPPVIESPKPKTNRKLLMVVAVVVLLLAAGSAAAYFLAFKNKQIPSSTLTPVAEATPDPTADWRTIKFNTWEFKVPNNWHSCSWVEEGISVRKEFKSDEIKKIPAECTTTATKEVTDSIFISIYEPSIDASHDASSEIRIGGEVGYLSETVLESFPSIPKTYIDIPSKKTRIVWGKKNELFDQILSTFKFIDSSSTTQTTPKIPSDWKSFTETDLDFGVKTTMSLPPGFSFKFTGSEFTIQKDSDVSELWGYSTSIMRIADGVYATEDGKPKNYYDLGSRRDWYTKFFEYVNGKGSENKISSFEDKTENGISYLVANIQTPQGAQKHYLYTQNGIIQILRPTSEKAVLSTAVVAKNIVTILYSINSSNLN